jgi:transposase
LQAVACRATGAVYRFAPNWKEKHGLSHLADARGILQAPSHGLQANHCRVMDGYKGCAKLYEPEPDGVLRLRGKEEQTAFLWKDGPTNACWAHLRRARHCPRTNGGQCSLHDFWAPHKSKIARKALDRIGKLYHCLAGDVALSRLRFGLSTHLCGLSFECQGAFPAER